MKLKGNFNFLILLFVAQPSLNICFAQCLLIFDRTVSEPFRIKTSIALKTFIFNAKNVLVC